MRKKFKLTDEIMVLNGHVLHRIVALRDFVNVDAGDKGGWIEKESNLSHHGNCWVFDEAKVYGDVKLRDDIAIHGNIQLFAPVLYEARDTVPMNVNFNINISADRKDMDYVDIPFMPNRTEYEEKMLFFNLIKKAIKL